MKNVRGIWLPDHEEHMLHFAQEDNWIYQGNKQEAVRKYFLGTKLAIDVGGHCGTWSRNLTKIFDEVIAFEPKQQHRECFVMNVDGNYTLYPYALGHKETLVGLHTTEGSSGNSYVEEGDSIEMRTLDSFHVKPDFIKIDCEGFEYFVIKGGENTIKECKPVMIVEQKPGNGQIFGLTETAAIDLLKEWGYVVREEIVGDFILTWS